MTCVRAGNGAVYVILKQSRLYANFLRIVTYHFHFLKYGNLRRAQNVNLMEVLEATSDFFCTSILNAAFCKCKMKIYIVFNPNGSSYKSNRRQCILSV